MPHQLLKSFFYIYGEGDTGKSALMDAFKLVLFGKTKSEEISALNMITIFTEHGSPHAWEPLLRARVAIAPEAACIKSRKTIRSKA